MTTTPTTFSRSQAARMRQAAAMLMLLARRCSASQRRAAAPTRRRNASPRGTAAGKFGACQHQASALRISAGSVRFQSALAKCTGRYASTWSKLQLRAQGTSARCAALRFVDNGDGTVTDGLTGLQWEQKQDLDLMPVPENPHDADNVYTWSAGGAPVPAANGTVFTSFVSALNDTCFAGQCDWRLPRSAELQTLLSASYPSCQLSPCIPSVFGSTPGAAYWTSTTTGDDLFSASCRTS